MYWRATASGAPPELAAKSDGDHSAPFRSCFWMSDHSLRSKRPDTPFRLLTGLETATFGGYATRRWTCRASAAHIVFAVHLGQLRLDVGTDLDQDRALPVAGVAITPLRQYFATKTTWMRSLKTQCRPLRCYPS